MHCAKLFHLNAVETRIQEHAGAHKKYPVELLIIANWVLSISFAYLVFNQTETSNIRM